MATDPWTWNPTTQRWTNAATGQTMTALAYSAYRRGVSPPTGSNVSINLGNNNSGYGQGGGPGGQEGGGIFNPPGPATGPFGPTVPINPPTRPTPPGQPPPTDTKNKPKADDRSTWKKVLEAILGKQAAAGSLPAIMTLLGNLSRNAANIEAGRARGRVDEANIYNQYDRTNILRNQQYVPRAETELDQRKYIDDRYQRNLANATWGASIPNIHDFEITGLPDRVASHIPSSTGGLRPSILSDADASAIGGQAYRDAQLAFLNPLSPGTAPEGTPNRLAALPEPPALTPFPTGGTTDDILNWMTWIGLIPGSQPTTPTTPTTGNTTATKTAPNTNNPYGDLTMPTAPADRQPDSISDTTPQNPRTQVASVEPTLGVNVGQYAPIPIDRPGDIYDPNKTLLPRISPYAYAQPFGRTA